MIINGSFIAEELDEFIPFEPVAAQVQRIIFAFIISVKFEYNESVSYSGAGRET